jgi:hypothetical protein
MTTGRHVVAASIVMTVRHVVRAVMTTGHLVVAASIAMTVRHAAHAVMTTGHLVVAVSIVTTAHLVVAVLIVTTVRAAKIRAQQHSVALMKSACEPVDVEQQARCLVHQTAPAKSGLMKVPRGQRVVPQVFVQRQRGVHKKAAAGKFAHSTAWWKSLSAPSVRVHQFAL